MIKIIIVTIIIITIIKIIVIIIIIEYERTLLNSSQIENLYKFSITIVKNDFLVVWWFSTERM